jgi:predicted DNA-binding transcriptional regulator AlpA
MAHPKSTPSSTGQIPPEYLRANQIAGPGGLLPVSKSFFYQAVRAGRIPRGIALTARVVIWPRRQILELLGGDHNG